MSGRKQPLRGKRAERNFTYGEGASVKRGQGKIKPRRDGYMSKKVGGKFTKK